MRPISITAALAALAAAASSVPAGAGAATAPRVALFEARVSGVQTTEWTTHRDDPPGPCSIGYDGKGNERIEFASKQPVRLDVTRLAERVIVVNVLHGGEASLPVVAHVIRHGHVKEWSNSSQPCGGGDGSGPPPPPPPAPDCGHRTTVWDLSLRESPTYDGFALATGEIAPLVGYRNCPVAGSGFPSMLTTNRFGRTIVAHVRPSTLFDRSRRTIVAIGHGTYRVGAGGESSYSTIEWTLRLRRVR